jgi:hypothetical protein
MSSNTVVAQQYLNGHRPHIATVTERLSVLDYGNPYPLQPDPKAETVKFPKQSLTLFHPFVTLSSLLDKPMHCKKMEPIVPIHRIVVCGGKILLNETGVGYDIWGIV